MLSTAFVFLHVFPSLCLCFGFVPASGLWFWGLHFLDGPCALEQE